MGGEARAVASATGDAVEAVDAVVEAGAGTEVAGAVVAGVPPRSCSLGEPPWLPCLTGGTLRRNPRTDIGRVRMTYLPGECSDRRAEEEVEDIQRRWSACPQ